MKSLFEIQTESGQLWIDISAHLAAAQEAADKQVNEAKADLDAANKQVGDLTKQLEAGKAILIAHQQESDRLANEAEAAFASGEVEKLPAIIAEAKLFGNAREKKKLLEEAAAFKKQAVENEARAAELVEKAETL